MSDAPDTIWIWAFSKDGELHRNEGSWPAQQTDEAAKQPSPIQYRRADLVESVSALREAMQEIERLRAEVERLESERQVQDAALECKRQDYRELVKITEAELATERQRARLPEELVERIRTAVEYDLQEQFGGNLVKRILEDILAAVEPQP